MAWDRLGSSYDAVAGRYEATFGDELDVKPRDRELLAAFAGSVADPVVEIGCGPGQVGGYVHRLGRWVVGVDLSKTMAGLATARLPAAVVADMRRLPLASASAGGILAFYSLIHLRRREVRQVLVEFRRVLRPGGRVLFSAHEGAGEIEREEFLGERVPFVATLFGLDELVAAATAAGLAVVRADRRPPYPSESGTVRLYVEADRQMNSAGRRPAP